jgi:hypothetical protein
MARSLEQWVDSVAKQLRNVPEDMRKATALQLVKGVQELQRTAPRRQRPKLVRRGPALYHSIKMERQALHVYTDHPGAEILDRGGVIKPRGQFLLVPLTRAAIAVGQTITVPGRNGSRVVLPKGGGKPLGLLLRRVFIRPRKWITRGIEVAEQGADERIANAILPGER